MSNDLGFEPTEEEDYYFLSYNSEDAERVGKFAKPLSHEMPIWYDYGIDYGDRWEKIISVKLAKSKAIILFFTQGILDKSYLSYAQKEFRMGKSKNKRILVVMMDRITEVRDSELAFWDDICQIQNIDANLDNPESVCHKIIEALIKFEENADHVPTNLDSGPTIDTNDSITHDVIEPIVDKIPIDRDEWKRYRRKEKKEKEKAIREDVALRLTGHKEALAYLIETKQFIAKDIYQHAKSAMMIVEDAQTLIEVDEDFWGYYGSHAINNFTSNYKVNVDKLKKIFLNEKYKPEECDWRQIKQIVNGLEDVIEKINK